MALTYSLADDADLLVHTPDPAARIRIIERQGIGSVLVLSATAVHDEDPNVRLSAVKKITTIGDRNAATHLGILSYGANDSAVRQIAEDAHRRLERQGVLSYLPRLPTP